MRNEWVIGWALAGLLLGTSAAGCGDGGGGGGGGGDSGPGNDQERIDMCLAEAPEVNACSTCGCENCIDQLEECDNTPGCRDIVECGLAEGCSGISCYLDGSTPGPCADTIDGHGGPTEAAALQALSVGNCTQAADCPCGN
jgi:hypothetical protein